MLEKEFISGSQRETEALAEKIGQKIRGGEVIVLISDLGGGKTTFTRGLARGFGSSDNVASPSFTISYVYTRDDGKQLHHYDFYRLDDPGVVGIELSESVGDDSVLTVIEWADIVEDELPERRLTVKIKSLGETKRQFTFRYPEGMNYLFADID